MSELTDYYNDLGITQPIIERVDAARALVTALGVSQVDDFFVSEYIQEEKGAQTRVYESVFFFYKNYIFEAKNFIQGDTIDCTTLDCFHYWEVAKKSFDFQTATDQSGLRIQLGYGMHLQCHFKASGKNCLKVWSVFSERIRGHLTKW
jgi:hypothetical protein